MVHRRVDRSGQLPAAAVVACLLGLLCAACLPVAPSPSPQPPTDTATATPTFAFPTIQPSRTPTPGATFTPTGPDLSGLGEPIYAAEFERAPGWPLGSDAVGATSLSDGALSIVVNQPDSLRLVPSPASPIADFYIEAVMRPLVCTPEDEFGLVFRLQPDGDHYRATLSCSGGVRIRRVIGGSQRLLVPGLDSSPAVFAGPLAENKLAVHAVGPDLRVFVNGVLVLEARDVELTIGQVGLAVQADDQGQTTVSVPVFLLYNATAALARPAAFGAADG